MKNSILDDLASGLKQGKMRFEQQLVTLEAETATTVLSDLADTYFCRGFERHMAGLGTPEAPAPYTVLGLGTYGRRELGLFSRATILLLYEDSSPPGGLDLYIPPLQTRGLDFHAIEASLPDLSKRFDNTPEVLLDMLDARFVCGRPELFTQLTAWVREKRILPNAGDLIDALITQARHRREKFGDAAALLEPDLLNGQGGLRDLHALLWIAKIRFDLKDPRDLEYFGHLSHDEYHELTAAGALIWKIRQLYHLMRGRVANQLLMDFQIRLAAHLGYGPQNGQKGVERFIGELHRHMAVIKRQYLNFINELGLSEFAPRSSTAPPPGAIPGLEIRHGLLGFTSSEAILKDPEVLARIFAQSAAAQIPLNAEARRLVREFRYLVDDSLRASRRVVSAFEHALASPAEGLDVTGDMLSTGFLTAFIPEFEDLVNRIQYNQYHIYPVDRHCLITLDIVGQMGTDIHQRQDGAPSQDDPAPGIDPECRQIYTHLREPMILHWAALLHDIGKGGTGGTGEHSKRGAELTRRILKRHPIPAHAVEAICTLVREHLFLMVIATRRDVDDEETALFCARHIQDPQLLKMLYLLSVADAMATGPKAWNSWTAWLLKDLYHKTLEMLEGADLAGRDALEINAYKRSAIMAAARDTAESDFFQNIFNAFGPRYLHYMPIEDILGHIRMYRGLSDRGFVMDLANNPATDTMTLTICTSDRPGLFSLLNGALALNHIAVLDARIYTWHNQTALDVFEVRLSADLDADIIRISLDRSLVQILEGGLEPSAFMFPRPRRTTRDSAAPPDSHRIVIDNRISSFFTLIEIHFDDAPWRLFGITHMLFKAGLDISVAKIGTRVDQIVGVFYVRDTDGQKITDPERESQIKAAIHEVFTP